MGFLLLLFHFYVFRFMFFKKLILNFLVAYLDRLAASTCQRLSVTTTMAARTTSVTRPVELATTTTALANALICRTFATLPTATQPRQSTRSASNRALCAHATTTARSPSATPTAL
jgi:hypothetical protein